MPEPDSDEFRQKLSFSNCPDLIRMNLNKCFNLVNLGPGNAPRPDHMPPGLKTSTATPAHMGMNCTNTWPPTPGGELHHHLALLPVCNWRRTAPPPSTAPQPCPEPLMQRNAHCTTHHRPGARSTFTGAHTAPQRGCELAMQKTTVNQTRPRLSLIHI